MIEAAARSKVESRLSSVPGFLIFDGEANKIHTVIAGVVARDRRFGELPGPLQEFALRQGMRFGLMPEQGLIPHAIRTGQDKLVASIVKRRDAMREGGDDEGKINNTSVIKMRKALAADKVRRRFGQVSDEPDPELGDNGRTVLDLTEGVVVALHNSQ